MDEPSKTTGTFAGRIARNSVRLARRMGEELGKDDLAGLAAQMTYYFMLALFPMMILAFGVLDALPLEQDVDRIAKRFLSGFPDDVAQLLRRFLQDFARNKPSGGLILWAPPALWAASRGIAGARKGLNRVFRGTKHGLIRGRLRDLAFTLVMLVLVGLSYVLVLGGRELGTLVATWLRLGDTVPLLWQWLSWPVTVILLTGFVLLAYRYLPSRKVAWRHLLVGALPAVLGWMLLLAAFRLWLRLMGGINELYGVLTSFFLLMIELWLISLVLLLGGELAARRADRSADRREEASARA